MAVAAAIGVGGLDEGDGGPSSNVMDGHRLSKHLRNKVLDSNSSMHKMVVDTQLKSSEVAASSSGGILGEINRSIEKMSLTLEDAVPGPCQSSKPTEKPNNNDIKHTEKNINSFTTLFSSATNANAIICNTNNTSRRGSDWTTVSTEGYGSMCGSDQLSTLASRRPSDISVSSFSQVFTR